MPSDMPKLFLTRHGDTAWTDSHQRTCRADLPLNKAGEMRARQIGERLRRYSLARVFTSPLQRASRTCELAGFGAVAQVEPDLVEWDDGHSEGTLTRDNARSSGRHRAVTGGARGPRPSVPGGGALGRDAVLAGPAGRGLRFRESLIR